MGTQDRGGADSGSFCIVSASGDRCQKVCDAITGKCLSTICIPEQWQVASSSIDRACTKAVVDCWSRSDMLAEFIGWDIVSDNQLFRIGRQGRRGSPWSIVQFNNSGTKFAASDEIVGEVVGVYSAYTGELQQTIKAVCPISPFSFDDARILTATQTGIKVWDSEGGSELTPPGDAMSERVIIVAVGNVSYLVAGVVNRNIRVWDFSTGRALSDFDTAKFEIAGGAFGSNDEVWVVSLKKYGTRIGRTPILRRACYTLVIWNIRSQNCLHTVSLESSTACVIFNEYKNSVLLSNKNFIWQVSLETGKQFSKTAKFEGRLFNLVVAPSRVVLL
jgi:WD40 repeat protein